MATLRTLAIALAAAVLVWTSSPALGGQPAGRGHGVASAVRSHAATTTHAKPPSNAGGKKRGLDRADEVAGEHGKQGRATAREHAASQTAGQ
jgi:hypothetical protein